MVLSAAVSAVLVLLLGVVLFRPGCGDVQWCGSGPVPAECEVAVEDFHPGNVRSLTFEGVPYVCPGDPVWLVLHGQALVDTPW